MWCDNRVFDNNPTQVFLFYQSKLDRQQPIKVFFKPFVKDNNLTPMNYCYLIFKILIFYKSCGLLIRYKFGSCSSCLL
jgi:hypothetical protein